MIIEIDIKRGFFLCHITGITADSIGVIVDVDGVMVDLEGGIVSLPDGRETKNH